MIENRIKVAKDKADLVRSLKASNNPTAPFQTYVEVMVFAAALGVYKNKRVPLEEVSTRDPDPIPKEHFINNGYDLSINLIAISVAKEQTILSSNEGIINQRIQIFEEYANGGLEILKEELRGSVDYINQILLMLITFKSPQQDKNTEFNLSRYL